MKILFIHPNYPAQYKHLAKHFGADPKNEVVFITKPKVPTIPGVKLVEYKVSREPSHNVHKYLIPYERAIYSAQEVWRVCNRLKKEGFTPDVICCHPGWGDSLLLKDVYPNSPLLNFIEFYYRSKGSDVGFYGEESSTPDNEARIRIKNSNNIMALETCDWAITPTFWQQVQNPREFLPKISVLHDGVDTDMIQPKERAKIQLPGGIVLDENTQIITHVERNFEPYRGFPTFMHAMKIVMEERPNVHVLVAGADGISYGRGPEEKGKTYRQIYMEETKLDTSRIHFVGRLEYQQYLSLLQASDVHIYLTVPFVLSWSMLESMAAGCALVASDTAPVLEVIKEGENGLLADFHDPKSVAKRVIEVLDHPDGMAQMRKNARDTIVKGYDTKKLLPMHVSLIEDLANGQLPPNAHNTIKEFQKSSAHKGTIDFSQCHFDSANNFIDSKTGNILQDNSKLKENSSNDEGWVVNS